MLQAERTTSCMPVGAFGHQSMRAGHLSLNHCRMWKDTLGPKIWKRYLMDGGCRASLRKASGPYETNSWNSRLLFSGEINDSVDIAGLPIEFGEVSEAEALRIRGAVFRALLDRVNTRMLDLSIVARAYEREVELVERRALMMLPPQSLVRKA